MEKQSSLIDQGIIPINQRAHCWESYDERSSQSQVSDRLLRKPAGIVGRKR